MAASVVFPFWILTPVSVSVMPARPPPSRTPRIFPPNSFPSSRSSAADVKQFLARLLVLVTKGRVTPRRASVLAYITNQLLHSHSASSRENREQDDHPQQLIIDLPRPKRDDPLPNELPGRPGQPS